MQSLLAGSRPSHDVRIAHQGAFMHLPASPPAAQQKKARGISHPELDRRYGQATADSIAVNGYDPAGRRRHAFLRLRDDCGKRSPIEDRIGHKHSLCQSGGDLGARPFPLARISAWTAWGLAGVRWRAGIGSRCSKEVVPRWRHSGASYPWLRCASDRRDNRHRRRPVGCFGVGA